MTKIVHLSTMDFGGAGKAAARLNAALRSAGADSEMLVACRKSEDPGVRLLPEAVSPVLPDGRWEEMYRTWGEALSAYPSRPSGLELFSDAQTGVRLDRVAAIRDAGIVNLHWVAGTLDYARAGQELTGKKVIWTLHDMNPFTGGCHYSGGCERYRTSCGCCPQLGSDRDQDLSRRVFEAKAAGYRNLDIHVVTPSRWLADCARKSALLGNFPVSVVPNGLPLDVFRPLPSPAARREAGIPKGAKVLLFGADYIAHRKGYSLLLEALSRFPRPAREGIVLASFGPLPEGDIPEGFGKMAFGTIGDEEALAKVYNLADAFVLPSLEDNLPNTMAEALACGVPVAGFAVGGIPDLVVPGETGFLATAGDAPCLARAILDTLSGNEGRAMAASCRRQAERFCAPEIQAAAYLTIYAEPEGDKPGRQPGGSVRRSSPAGTLPRISIVTPSFNQAGYLEECIDSILSQGYPNLEYIIMDGGSTDGSVDIIRKYARHLAYWQSCPDGGHYAALNEGFRRSSGEIMGWLNSDDKYHPGGLSVLADVFSARPDIAFLTGRREGFDAEGNLRGYGFETQVWSRSLLLDPATVRRHLFVMQEATYWRRWLWEKAGGALDIAWKQAGDYELWLRFTRHAPLHTVDARIAGFRMYGAGQRSQALVGDYLAECERAIERDRTIPSDNPALDAVAPALIAHPLRDAIPAGLEPGGFRDYHYAKQRHFDRFGGADLALFGERVDPDYCDLKAYQDLLVFSFIKEHVPPGSRILDIGGGNSRILRHFKDAYECWNLDKLEGVGNGPRTVEASGYRLVSDYIGNFNAELPEEYFDFVFSISTLEHVPSGLEANRELYKNICIDIDRVLKPGGFSLHCFDIMLSSGRNWGHEFMEFMAANCMADPPGTTLEEMARDPERYVISRRFFEDYWKPPAVEWKYDDGMPSSCNLFWRKGAEGAPRDPSMRWEHYKRFRVALDARYPRISVVSPSFNQAPFLAETLESVLGQRYPNLEYIVMDGGSTDGSVDIIRRYGAFLAHWQSLQDGGQYRAINEGLQRATGEIMTWINSDDRLCPGAFAFVALAFLEHPEVRWLMGRPNGIDAEGRQAWVYDHLPAWSRGKYLAKQYRDPYIQQEGTFWRRSLWEEAGGFLRGDMQYAGDLELWTRFFRHAQLHTADALLGSYRQHPGQKTAQYLEKYHEEAGIVLEFEQELFIHAKDKTLLPAPSPIRYRSDASQEASPAPIRSNLEYWKSIQDDDYFERHACYGGLVETGGEDLMISPFLDLDREMTAVVIGCGYGRDTLAIAPRVKRVYGIDVTPGILRKAEKFLSEHDVRNFVPVLADEWKQAIPDGIDFAFSVIVFQHLTRDLVKDYVAGLGRKLSDRGLFVCQFADLDYGTHDADLRKYEPSVRWSVAEIEELIRDTGLFRHAIESVTIPGHGRWHWACFGKKERT
ncbi:MAG TPA: glycosyltransferase [Candidatus Deferrimicrobiaceae bacterium]|jgi:glycosyltransferase involved in cell wall biosynthesis